ncbi:MAG: hypothetical protein Q8O56_04620 [Solirubrobacteraceae bacterium]|nr:hypothetical protein [Solirubrobacteraceae bacterium]
MEQADGDVAAVGVGAERERPLPGRADRNTVERDDLPLLASDDDGVGEMVAGRRRAGDLRPQRGGEREADERQEQRAEGERGPVAPQPAPGQRRRAQPMRGCCVMALSPAVLTSYFKQSCVKSRL